MTKSLGDNENKLRGILNKWFGREETITKMFSNVVDKINDDCHIEKTYDQVITLLDFYINRELLQR